MGERTDNLDSFFLSGGFAYLLYLIFALMMLPVYRLQLNPDAVSYFGIASEYLHGHFHDAINGAFSPLYSWLLMPFIGAGLGGPLAARLVAIPIGAGVIFAADRLGRNIGVAAEARAMVRLGLAVVVVSLGFIVVTPDLLATWLTLLYLLVICSPGYLRRPGWWVITGLTGGILYLAKAYAMWFFVGHYVLVHVVWFAGAECRSVDTPATRPASGPAEQGRVESSANCSEQYTARKRIAASLFVGLIMFGIVSAPWAAALSWKYGRFALNTTGQYNHAIEAPHAPDFPPTALGLLPPPTLGATSVWEDASTMHLPDWNEFANAANFKHYLLIIARNIGDLAEELCCYSWFLPATVIAVLIVATRGRFAGAEGILALAVIIYPLGYLVRHVEQRFLSAPVIVLILLAAMLIDRAFRNYALPLAHRRLAIGALCISLLPNPIWNLVRYAGGEGKRLQNVGRYVSEFVPAHANVASDSDWFTSMYASYYAQLRYYGVPKPSDTADDFGRELSAQHVRYVLLWSNSSIELLPNWERLTPADAPAPAVYFSSVTK